MNLALFACIIFLGGSLILLSYAADREITLRTERAALTRIPAQPFGVNSEMVFSSERSPYMRSER
jgi:hypothetical protein